MYRFRSLGESIVQTKEGHKIGVMVGIDPLFASLTRTL